MGGWVLLAAGGAAVGGCWIGVSSGGRVGEGGGVRARGVSVVVVACKASSLAAAQRVQFYCDRWARACSNLGVWFFDFSSMVDFAPLRAATNEAYVHMCPVKWVVPRW